MSRFTVSILLATALLGVLLWIVVSMAVDFAKAPEQALTPPDQVPVFDPELSWINSREELLLFLGPLTDNPVMLVADAEQWLENRGFPDGYRLISGPSGENTLIDNADDAELLILAGNSDLDAMHELAERSLREQQDPLEALAWYDRAVVNGSLYAMLRVADLITTLSDPALSGFSSNEPEWAAAVEEISAASPPPAERALAWSVAAVIMGGYAIIDKGHAARLTAMAEQLDEAGRERACETAQQYVLEAAASRRALGSAVFSMEAPPLALTVDQPEQTLPCKYPLTPLVTLDACSVHPYVGAGPQLMNAVICSG